MQSLVALGAIVGGALAIFELQLPRCFVGRAVLTWACLYAAFVVYIVVSS